jgi:hypothetical protein
MCTLHSTYQKPSYILLLEKKEENQTKLVHIRTNKKIEITTNLNNDLND